MNYNKSEFFQLATEHLLSSINLSEGLIKLREFLNSIMPVESIRLLSYPLRSHGQEKVLIIRSTKQEDVTFLAKTPENIEKIQILHRNTIDHGVLVTDSNTPLASWYINQKKLEREVPPLPWYVMSLWLENKFLGECQFSGRKNEVFSDEDCRLLDLLRPLFRLALNNYQQYIQIHEDREDTKKENLKLKEVIENRTEKVSIIGAQGGLKNVIDRLRMLAFYNIPVLITGETGTGKEVIAKECHNLSQRFKRQFIAVNCGAIPPALSDSELFGHVRGSFTGAIRDHKGFFELADGGTLFLDEIGELPLDTQVKLLRVLQEHVIMPIGGINAIHVDTRIIAATNKNLSEMVKNGTFREDLYYRLNVGRIEVPPLRDRLEDIPLFVHYFVQKFASDSDIIPPIITKNEILKLQSYSWPGNVRELENVITESIITSKIGEIIKFNIPTNKNTTEFKIIEYNKCSTMKDEYANLYVKCNGRIKGPKGMAALLKIHPSTLRYRLKKLGILDEE